MTAPPPKEPTIEKETTKEEDDDEEATLDMSDPSVIALLQRMCEKMTTHGDDGDVHFLARVINYI